MVFDSINLSGEDLYDNLVVNQNALFEYDAENERTVIDSTQVLSTPGVMLGTKFTLTPNYKYRIRIRAQDVTSANSPFVWLGVRTAKNLLGRAYEYSTTAETHDFIYHHQTDTVSNVELGVLTSEATVDSQFYVYSIEIYVEQNNQPHGSVMPFCATTPPDGYMLCDGSSLSTSHYSKLYEAIGTSFGSGEGTFQLPDLRGRVPVGMGQGSGLTERTLAATDGEETHTLTTSEMPVHNHETTSDGVHTHTITDPGHTHIYAANTNDQGTDNAFSTETAADDVENPGTTGTSTTGISLNSDGGHTHTISNTGGGAAHNNMQPYLVMNYIIKY